MVDIMLTEQTILKLIEEVGTHCTASVLRMEGILHSTKVKCDGKFEVKIKRKFSNLLGECDETATTTLSLLLAAADYQARTSLNGLGGCTVPDSITVVLRRSSKLR